MGESTGISWCDATVNWWWGCTKTSDACDFCYAETWARRLGKDLWGPGKPRQKIKGAVDLAFKLQRRAVREGRRLRVFSNSMSDVFDAEVPDDWRDEAFAAMALTPDLDWLVLTKRAKVMRAYISDPGTPGRVWAKARELNRARRNTGNLSRAVADLPLPNVWLGVTAENQTFADQRIPILLDTPAAKRFVSIEPMLGPVDLTTAPVSGRSGWLSPLSGHHHLQPVHADHSGARLDLVITGGESGPKARPMSVQWARELRDQCVQAGVPFHFKQWGEWAPAGAMRASAPGRYAFGDYEHDRAKMVQVDGYPREFTRLGARSTMRRIGTKPAGRLLDGEIWDQMPEPAA